MAKKSRKQRKQQAAQQQNTQVEQQNNQPDVEDDVDEAVASANDALATNQPLVSLAGAAPMIGFADDEDEDVEDYPYPEEDDDDVLERATAAVKGRPSKRKKRSISKASPIVEQNQNANLDHEKVMQKLANPTIVVTEEQMRAEYGYVLRDIRNMFVLAGVLIVALLLMAQFI